MASGSKIPLHVEVRLAEETTCPDKPALAATIDKWLHENFKSLIVEEHISSTDQCAFLPTGVEDLYVSEAVGIADIVPLSDVHLHVHVYKLLHEREREFRPEDTSENSYRIMDLPAASLDKLWDSLMFEPGLKSKLLSFVSTISFFADKQVDLMSIGFNRLILLHGPPGSGKTSLARALAQKLSIRLSAQYPQCQLFEINSHNLFSKYFSESATLVGQMFDRILKLLEDGRVFIVLLIDEVETLLPSRMKAIGGGEPNDGIRVVNALLTALDKLRTKNNVIVLTTSNLLQSMDPAFLDRADMKQFIDTPSTPAIYSILRTGLHELIRAGIIISPSPIPCATEASLSLFRLPDAPSTRLWNCAKNCVGMSGRELGKTIILMHANYIQRSRCMLEEALNALEKSVGDRRDERGKRDSDSRIGRETAGLDGGSGRSL